MDLNHRPYHTVRKETLPPRKDLQPREREIHSPSRINADQIVSKRRTWTRRMEYALLSTTELPPQTPERWKSKTDQRSKSASNNL